MADNNFWESEMKKRCEDEGHRWENGVTAFFQMVFICKWCGFRSSSEHGGKYA